MGDFITRRRWGLEQVANVILTIHHHATEIVWIVSECVRLAANSYEMTNFWTHLFVDRLLTRATIFSWMTGCKGAIRLAFANDKALTAKNSELVLFPKRKALALIARVNWQFPRHGRAFVPECYFEAPANTDRSGTFALPHRTKRTWISSSSKRI